MREQDFKTTFIRFHYLSQSQKRHNGIHNSFRFTRSHYFVYARVKKKKKRIYLYIVLFFIVHTSSLAVPYGLDRRAAPPAPAKTGGPWTVRYGWRKHRRLECIKRAAGRNRRNLDALIMNTPNDRWRWSRLARIFRQRRLRRVEFSHVCATMGTVWVSFDED